MDYESQRRSIRLKGYDYASTGAYFVTICARGLQMFFTDPVLKQIVEETWYSQPKRFPSISLDALAVMPNHVHLIVWLNAVGAPLAGARAPRPRRAGASPAPTLSQVIGAFKSIVATNWRRRNALYGSARVWQRNYYERIIRDEDELNRVRDYILLNPLKWEFDRENPLRVANSQYEEQWHWLEASEQGWFGRSRHMPIAEKRHD